jgi:pyruvate,orthophosphate dikinase
MAQPPLFSFGEFNKASAIIGKNKLKTVLGTKGANLCELTFAGAPVPKGFVITNELSISYYAADPHAYPEAFWTQVKDAVTKLEGETQKKFGGSEQPFFLTIRNSPDVTYAKNLVSFFNVGFNSGSAAGLSAALEDPKFGWLSYLQFIQTYSSQILKFESDKMTDLIQAGKAEKGVQQESDLEVEDLEALCKTVSEAVETFPQDPYEQLKGGINYVIESWESQGAVDFRTSNGFSSDTGFGLIIQIHVFGNFGANSGCGLYYTRNPSTGERTMSGSFIVTGTGPEFQSKSKPPQPIASLETQIPSGFEKINEANKSLEKHYRDIEKVDFVIENGISWVVQSRSSRRTPTAALKLSVDFVNEGVVTKEESIKSLSLTEVETFLADSFRPEDISQVRDRRFVNGTSTGSGSIVGGVCVSRLKTSEISDAILFIDATVWTDFSGLPRLKALIIKGNAIVGSAALEFARRRGIVAIYGVEVSIDSDNGTITSGAKILREGEAISIDGQSGDIYQCQLSLSSVVIEEKADFQQLLLWADEIRRNRGSRKSMNNGPTTGLQIFANINHPDDIASAKSAGAEGFGVVCTDYMMSGERKSLVSRALFPKDQEDHDAAFQELEEAITADSIALLEAISGQPAYIRLFDPPLSEFVPDVYEATELVSFLEGKRELGLEVDEAELSSQIKRLEQIRLFTASNCAFGIRGVRFLLSVPGLLKLQFRGLIEAVYASLERGIRPELELLIPYVSGPEEMSKVKIDLRTIQTASTKSHETSVSVKLGSEIGVPRAALLSDKLSNQTEFLSFNTDDLTSSLFVASRSEAEAAFLCLYRDWGIVDNSPFESLDYEGVGELMNVSVELARKSNNELVIGASGYQTNDWKSIEHFHRIGLNYISCSSSRIPIIRLAAAQAVLNEQVEEVPEIPTEITEEAAAHETETDYTQEDD